METEIVVQVLPCAPALPGHVHVMIAYDIWGKPGVADAIRQAIQWTFDKPSEQAESAVKPDEEV